MSVEGNENMNKELDQILKEEYKQDWKTVALTPRIMALICYCVPSLAIMAGHNYHHYNAVTSLFFSLVIGTSLFFGVRYSVAMRAFQSNDKPSARVLSAIRAQEGKATMSDEEAAETAIVLAPEEMDWDSLVSSFEETMNSDDMDLSTLFERSESQQRTQSRKGSWFDRFFRRN